MTAVERISPPTSMPASETPSSASMAAAAAPVCPGTRPTSTAGASSASAVRATFTPLPPGVMTASSKRSTSPGRSSAICSVRSMVRFGPAISMAAPGAGGIRASEARDYRRMSAAFRLNRLFDARSGRCIDVAVDHGFFGEAALLHGIEDMPGAIATLVAAGPDAIQLAPGQAPLLQRLPGPKPALVLRIDVTNAYEPDPPAQAFSLLVDDAIGLAVRLDAACVCVNLLDAPGQGELRHQCLRNIATARAACERAGMPLMVEPLVLDRGTGGYADVGDVDRIVPLVRQAAEMGADLIKAHTTDDLADYGRVVTAAGVPVLPRGGSRADDREVLERTHAILRAGAAGIVYGRNVIQRGDPVAMVRALRALVHDDATPDAAEAELAGAAAAAAPAR